MDTECEKMVSDFITGRFEAETQKNEEAITDLENLNPSFDELRRMLESEFRSAQGAALYILYNRDLPFPKNVLRVIKNIASKGHPSLRTWAQSNLKDHG